MGAGAQGQTQGGPLFGHLAGALPAPELSSVFVTRHTQSSRDSLLTQML